MADPAPSPTPTINVALPADRPSVYAFGDKVFYRASALASCTRQLVALRLGFQAMSPPSFMQVKFDEGHAWEPKILREVDSLGYRISTQQEPIEPIQVGRAYITGTMDALAAHDHWGSCVVEAKAFAQSTWDTWHRSHWEAFPYYAWQVSIYHHATGGLPVVFTVKNKETDELDITVVTEPLVALSRIKAKVAKVEGLAAKGVPPNDCDTRSFPCPVFYLCSSPDLVLDLDDARLDALAAAYDHADEESKRAASLRSSARTALLEALGERERVRTASWKVSAVEAKGPGRLDKAALAAAHPHIDLTDYMSQSTSRRVTVTKAGGGTGEDDE